MSVSDETEKTQPQSVESEQPAQEGPGSTEESTDVLPDTESSQTPEPQDSDVQGQEEVQIQNESEESIQTPETKIEENIESQTPEPVQKAQPKLNSQADLIVYEAREMVENIDSRINDCADILSADITLLEEAKAQLDEHSSNQTAILLEKIGFTQENDEEGARKVSMSFMSSSHVDPMKIDDLSSGKVSGFFYGLIVSFGVLGAWFYFAAKSLGVKLDTTILSNTQLQDQVLSWIGGGITGGTGSPTAGLATLTASMIIALIITLKLRVILKEKSNLVTANTIKEEAANYCTRKEACRLEMERISSHIHEMIDTLKTFGVLLDEQNAKMRRILHIEKDLHFDHLHQNSKEEITQANILLDTLSNLLKAPMANDNGSLSDESKYILAQTKIDLDKYIKRFY